MQALAASTVMERLTLLINHVLGAEPVAMQRLRPHAGAGIRIRLEGWPALLPAVPALAFCVTPAGLLEWLGEDAPADAELRVAIDARNPALALWRSLAGTRPQVEVAGDAGFAADVNWLFDNLRWDVQDDLAKIVGPAAARELGRAAAGIAAGMRRLGGLAARAQGGMASQPRSHAAPAEPTRQ